MLLGIDPDLGGALAVVQWMGFPQSIPLGETTVDMYDMPIMQVKVGKRMRRSVAIPCLGPFTCCNTGAFHGRPQAGPGMPVD